MRLAALFILTVTLFLPFFIGSGESITFFEKNFGKKCTVETQRYICGDELLCIGEVCTWCTDNQQCTERRSVNRCKDVWVRTQEEGKASVKKICTHKNLFPDVTWSDFLSTIAMFIGGALSGAAGVGGGGIFVPILHVLGQFPASIVIPLSKAMIFGSSVCNLFVMARESHPVTKGPLIDYDIVLLFEPITLLGTTIGVIFNIFLPEWLIILLLLVVLALTTARTLQKGVNQAKIEIARYKGENEENKEENDSEPLKEQGEDPEYQSLPQEEVDNNTEELSAGKVGEKESPLLNKTGILAAMLEEDRRLPVVKILLLVFCWILIILVSLLRGGHGTPSIANIASCSWLYWVLFSIPFPIILVITVLYAVYILQRQRKLLSLGYKPSKHDVKWSFINLTVYPLLCFGGGILASSLGIGGGMIVGPLLLEMGVDGHVSSASTSFMVLFTSSITSAQFLILGRLPLDYGLWYLMNGFFAGFFGQLFIGIPSRKYNFTFLVILSISIITLLSGLMMGGVGIYNTVRDIREGAYMGFKSIC